MVQDRLIESNKWIRYAADDLGRPTNSRPNFYILYRTLYLCSRWMQTTNLVHKLIVARPSLWMTNHLWKGCGYAT